MNFWMSFVAAMALTALCYFLGSFFTRNPIAIWQAAVIGIAVVSLGAATEALGAPLWLVVLIPFPVGMTLLYVFLGRGFTPWIITYVVTLGIYTLIHILASALFDYHSLIPAWRLG